MSGPVGRDPGVAAERTRLAWRRTGMSAAVVALLILRPAFAPEAGPAIFLIVAGAMAAWAALVAIGYRRSHGLKAWPPRPGERTVTIYTLIIVSLTVLSAAVVLA
jgi:hypothetical protein